MKEVYVVTEYGGQYEDKWDTVVAVCATKELAEEVKRSIEKAHSKEDCPISEERWDEMMDVYYESEEDGETVEVLHKLFPEYTEDELRAAETVYDDIWDFCGVMIKKINFTEHDNDLLNGYSY